MDGIGVTYFYPFVVVRRWVRFRTVNSVLNVFNLYITSLLVICKGYCFRVYLYEKSNLNFFLHYCVFFTVNSWLVESSTWSWTSSSRTPRISSTCWSCWTIVCPISRLVSFYSFLAKIRRFNPYFSLLLPIKVRFIYKYLKFRRDGFPYLTSWQTTGLYLFC